MSTRNPIGEADLAKAHESGYTALVAKMFGLKDGDAVVALRGANGQIHVCSQASPKGDSKLGRARAHAYIRSLTDGQYKRQFTPAFKAFLASIWQCRSTAIFDRMRARETYGRTDEQRATLSTAMKTKHGADSNGEYADRSGEGEEVNDEAVGVA